MLLSITPYVLELVQPMFGVHNDVVDNVGVSY